MSKGLIYISLFGTGHLLGARGLIEKIQHSDGLLSLSSFTLITLVLQKKSILLPMDGCLV